MDTQSLHPYILLFKLFILKNFRLTGKLQKLYKDFPYILPTEPPMLTFHRICFIILSKCHHTIYQN